VRNIADSSGAGINAIAYDGFGNMLSQTDSSLTGRYTFTSREKDYETGFYSNRARYYDPKTARWMSQDPLGFDAGDSNLYRYVNNTPTTNTDPTGLQATQPESVTTNLQSIPAARIREMWKDGLAQEHRGYMFIADVTPDGAYRMVLEPYRTHWEKVRNEVRGSSRPYIDRLVKTSLIKEQCWELTPNTYYKVVNYWHTPEPVKDPDAVVKEFRKNGWRSIDGVISGSEAADEQRFAGNITFGYHLLPFGAFWDHAAKGEVGEAAISLAGDAAFFLTGPLAGFAKTGRAAKNLRLLGLTVEAGVAATRTAQGFFALRDNDTMKAYGHFGEATLRLFGVSKQGIQILKEARRLAVLHREIAGQIQTLIQRNRPVSEIFEQIAQFRRELGLPAVRGLSDEPTVALVNIDERFYWGCSSANAPREQQRFIAQLAHAQGQTQPREKAT
jgi:RHS repeat-associated protein